MLPPDWAERRAKNQELATTSYSFARCCWYFLLSLGRFLRPLELFFLTCREPILLKGAPHRQGAYARLSLRHYACPAGRLIGCSFEIGLPRGRHRHQSARAGRRRCKNTYLGEKYLRSSRIQKVTFRSAATSKIWNKCCRKGLNKTHLKFPKDSRHKLFPSGLIFSGTCLLWFGCDCLFACVFVPMCRFLRLD